MKFSRRWWNRKFILHTFSCCGLKWELLLWKRDPDRFYWSPVCPTCGEDGMAWILLQMLKVGLGAKPEGLPPHKKQKWVEV
jgi:hypothetical protein